MTHTLQVRQSRHFWLRVAPEQANQSHGTAERRLTQFAHALFALVLAACSAAVTLPAGAGTLRVVATFSILGDLVHNVGGSELDLRILVGPDADTHTFEPTPADGASLARAQVIFENGFGLERWLEPLAQASDTRARRVVVTAGLQPGGISLGADRGAVDPHAWQDVAKTIKMIPLIRDALAQADPAHAAGYQANADRYIQALTELDGFIVAQAASLPSARRKLVTNHDALGYFAARYGFEIVGTALSSISTEGGDPSAAQVAALAAEIKSAGVPVIFTENVENAKVIEQIADESGVIVGQPLYTDALGQPGTDGDTYLKMMRHNIAAIVGGLSR
jgi:zinc/manganese transport system substrate-binding protein